MLTGLCPGCGVVKKMTKHHILPKRHFRAGGQTLLICRDCHSELELLIPQRRVKDVIFYYQVIVKFLNEKKGKEEDDEM